MTAENTDTGVNPSMDNGPVLSWIYQSRVEHFPLKYPRDTSVLVWGHVVS